MGHYDPIMSNSIDCARFTTETCRLSETYIIDGSHSVYIRKFFSLTLALDERLCSVRISSFKTNRDGEDGTLLAGT